MWRLYGYYTRLLPIESSLNARECEIECVKFWMVVVIVEGNCIE
jgi:hypothetical protein